MDFDFDSNDIGPSKKQQQNTPINEETVMQSLENNFISLPSKDLLPSVINAIHQLKLPLDEFMEALDHFTTTKSLNLSEATLKQFIIKEQTDSYGGLDLDNFHAFGVSSYDRELDRVSNIAAKKASIVTTKGFKAVQNNDDLDGGFDAFEMNNTSMTPSINENTTPSKLTTASHLRSHLSPHSTTKRGNGLRESGYKSTTASAKRRSQWTPLLTSPSTAFPEHHQKGQVLVRFAPQRSTSNNVSGNNKVSLLPDVTAATSASTMSQSTRMFDEVDLLNSPNTIQSGPSTPPVFVLNWIHYARSERRRLQQAKQNGVLIQPQTVVDPNDPLKLDHKPFRYMDWKHRLALGLSVKRARTLAGGFIAAQAYVKGLECLGIKRNTNNNNNNNNNNTNNNSTNNNNNNNNSTNGDNTTSTSSNDSEDSPDQMPIFCENFTQQQVRNTWYFGHIKNTTTKDLKLSNSSLIFSNYVSECPLRLIHRDLKHHSFFPGQVIVCRGTNVTGNAIIPDLILTESTLEKYSRKHWITAYWALVFAQAYKKQSAAQNSAATGAAVQNSAVSTRKSLFGAVETGNNNNNNNNENSTSVTSNDTNHFQNNNPSQIPSIDELNQVITSRPVKVMYCAGPFVSAKGSTTSISAILEHINDELTVPDVLIISGPFVDVESPQSTIRPVHSCNQAPREVQRDYYINNGADKSNNEVESSTTVTTTNNNNNNLKKNEISICNVPTFKSDVFSKYLSTPTPSPEHSDDSTSAVSLYKDLFAETMTHIVSSLNSNPLTQNITLITIPSTRDIHHYPCYPQPGYEYQYQPANAYMPNTVKVINAPNPCQLDINGVVFAVSTNDLVAELSKYEIFTQKASFEDSLSPFNSTPSTSNLNKVPSTPSKGSEELVQLGSSTSVQMNTPSTGNNKNNNTTPSTNNKINNNLSNNNNNLHSRVCLKDKRTVRLISHLLSQQSFAPISTMPSNPCIQNARTSLEMLCKPDILLLPSKLRFFIEQVPLPGQLSSNQHISDPTDDFMKEHGNVIAINPNSTVLGENLGSFAAITIYNDHAKQPNEHDNSVDIADRVHAEIIHL